MLEVLLTAALATSIPAFAAETHEFNVPAESAPVAIRDFASQARVQILVDDENVKDKQLHAVNGQYSTDQGLHILLADSGLKPQYVGDRSIALVTASRTTAAQQTKEVKKSPSKSFRVAEVDQGAPAAVGAAAVSRQSANEPVVLHEIVVTARKREERLMDVPVPVSAIDTTQLADNGQVLLRDYYNSVPSLNLNTGFFGYQQLTIRGISANGVNPTVGITIDDVPFSGMTAMSGAGIIPDIDPGDLDRIEVLRGPQGALYGTNSMGGLIKFVTKDPSTSGVSGRVEGGLSDTYNGDQAGYSFRGSVNVPLGDSLALRASGFARQDPGYIDNPFTGVEGINRARNDGGRIAALWRASDNISLKLSALYQDYRSDGLFDVNRAVNSYSGPPLGDLQQNYIPGVRGISREIQAYSAILNAKFAGIDLTSLTGYNVIQSNAGADYSSLYGGIIATDPIFGGVTGVPIEVPEDVRNFSQEIRLASAIGEKIDWRLGGIYLHQKYSADSVFYAADQSTGQVVGVFASNIIQATYEEYAAFADLTYHVTDRFNVQIGGRQTHSVLDVPVNWITGEIVNVFNLGPSPFVSPPVRSEGNVFTYLLTPQYKLSTNLMTYARFASGYRPGAANIPQPGAPTFANPDKTENYELGLKGDFLDQKLSVDVSLYYIDWRNIQLTLAQPNQLAYTGNAGRAKSQGVELSLQSRPLSGLTIGAWVSYDDAVLTEAFPSDVQAYGAAGDRLPNTNRISGNFSLQQEFAMWGRSRGYVGGQVSYVGDSLGGFTGSPGVPAMRQVYPAYTKTDLHAGLKYDSWTTHVYVNNVTDKRGLVGGGLGNLPDYAFLYITPRTVGISLTKTFD